VVLAVATIALCVVAVLQWRTLEKTDMTMNIPGLEIVRYFPIRAVPKKRVAVASTEISMEIENVGKEPAIKTNEELFATALPIQSFRNREAVERWMELHARAYRLVRTAGPRRSCRHHGRADQSRNWISTCAF
jgi:hypothetical protein